MTSGGKYGVSPVFMRTVDGVVFPSKLEADRFVILRAMERGGYIKDLRTQVPFELQPGFRYMGKAEQAITYVADFQYVNTAGLTVVEETKGKPTRDYLLKRKLFLFKNPDILFFEVKRANAAGGLYYGKPGWKGTAKAVERGRPASRVQKKGPAGGLAAH